MGDVCDEVFVYIQLYDSYLLSLVFFWIVLWGFDRRKLRYKFPEIKLYITKKDIYKEVDVFPAEFIEVRYYDMVRTLSARFPE